jgi:hypothetical protein
MVKDTQDAQTEVPETKASTETAPPKLGAKGQRAIQGPAEASEPASKTTANAADLDKRELSREDMRRLRGQGLSKAEKGEMGEKAMVKEDERLGRQMIAHHADNPNASGFDGISWDPKDRELCLQEAKNYQPGSTVAKNNLSAFEDRHWETNVDDAREAIRNSDLSKGDKIAAQAALRNRNFNTELYVPDGVKVGAPAQQLLAEKGGDVVVKQYDGRLLWSQERKVAGRSIS